MFDFTLPLMRKKYAKKVLVSATKGGQYYTRKKIHDNCPSFIYKIRHLDKINDANVNIMSIDST